MLIPPNEEARFALSLSGYSLNIRHHVLDVGRAYINEGREAFRKGVDDVFIWRRFIRCLRDGGAESALR